MTNSVADVASWMLEQIIQKGALYQDEAAMTIAEKFGDHFIKENDDGGISLEGEVLASFRSLTGDTVVWVRSDQMWRFREEHDVPGRQQP